MTTPIDKKFLENPELVERLAAIEHERWSVRMRHLFSKCGISHFRNGVESLEIPAWAGEQWKRQMNTPYADLTEAEKESDRVEVRKTLACLASQPKPTDNHIKRAHELFGAVMHHTVEEELWRIIQAIEDASPKPTTEELRRLVREIRKPLRDPLDSKYIWPIHVLSEEAAMKLLEDSR